MRAARAFRREVSLGLCESGAPCSLWRAKGTVLWRRLLPRDRLCGVRAVVEEQGDPGGWVAVDWDNRRAGIQAAYSDPRAPLGPLSGGVSSFPCHSCVSFIMHLRWETHLCAFLSPF